MLRRLYNVAAALALMHMLALAGAGVLLGSRGYLAPDKLRGVVQVLRGEAPAPGPPTGTEDAADAEGNSLGTPSPGANAGPAAIAGGGGPGAVDVAQVAQDAQEIAYREMERFKDEMDQRLALNNAIMLQITTRREALERDVQAFAQRQVSEVEVKDDEGFKKELEIFETLKPAVAMERLLGKGSVEDAARLMLQMDSRKVAKIIESAKTPSEKQRLQIILDRIREVAPEKLEDVGKVKNEEAQGAGG